jgi:hypothetical protein
MSRYALTTDRKNYITLNSCQQLISHKSPFSVTACPELYRCPALRETPQHGKRPIRDDFLERRIAGKHSLRRRERPRC